VSGHSVRFTLLGDNGSIRTIQGKTDSRGRAYADYIAGTVMGQVLVEIRDLTSGMVALVPIELRPDAPADIVLSADPGEMITGGETLVTARVSDANGNPNSSVDVLYELTVGAGEISSASVATDDDGVASVVFKAGDTGGIVTVRGTVTSRAPTTEERDAGDEVIEGQELVVLMDRYDDVYTVRSPRDGIMSVFTSQERDQVEYGDTLGYILPLAE